jgi:hypothetical protein
VRQRKKETRPRRRDGLCPECKEPKEHRERGYCNRCRTNLERVRRQQHPEVMELHRVRSLVNKQVQVAKRHRPPCRVCGEPKVWGYFLRPREPDRLEPHLVFWSKGVKQRVVHLCPPHHRAECRLRRQREATSPTG